MNSRQATEVNQDAFEGFGNTRRDWSKAEYFGGSDQRRRTQSDAK